MTAPAPPTSGKRAGLGRVAAVVAVAVCLSVVGAALLRRRPEPPPPSLPDSFLVPRSLATSQHLTVWWDGVPASVKQGARELGPDSNIHPADYSGPEACKQCHARNYESWATHPHRWMNAKAAEETVKGDFSGAAVVSYRGGQAAFSRRDGKFLMRLVRGDVRRTYEVTQTIGSRFYQYYIGRQVEGPEPRTHPFYTKDHVLHFGYWLDQKEWMPIVHVGPELPELERPDPFAPPERGRHYAEYASGCNYCHTTFPMGDMLGRAPDKMGDYAPAALHWSLSDYLRQTHPDQLAAVAEHADGKVAINPMTAWEAPHYAVTLGVSCEACHLGSKAHVESRGRATPRFFPASPHLFMEREKGRLDDGRSHDNVNWACGRCHVGNRPQFAAGMSTWNSVEYSDAMRGGCYSKLRCVDCHNPHKALGPRWPLTADQDDALCVRCHSKFEAPAPRAAHTHHPAGSEGARCMNCHMPRVNEGLQDVVRTHMIYSPTRPDMIEANHPNACNLCHTDRPIDWTLARLKEWYGAKFDEGKVAAAYPDRAAPVGHGWLKSDNMAVRLVAVDALVRGKDPKSLPHLLDALDDPYLVNRQFARKGVQEVLNLRLADFGYRFYETKEERRQPLADLRARLLGAARPSEEKGANPR